jgi:hypothetical protein
VIGKYQTTTQFGVWYHSTMPLEIPFQVQGIHTDAVCSVARLKY